MKLLGTKSEIK